MGGVKVRDKKTYEDAFELGERKRDDRADKRKKNYLPPPPPSPLYCSKRIEPSFKKPKFANAPGISDMGKGCWMRRGGGANV